MKQMHMILLGLGAFFLMNQKNANASSKTSPSQIPDKSGANKTHAPLMGQQPLSENGQIAKAGFEAAGKIGTSLFDWLSKSR